jgi:hypothetical protein
MSESPGRRRAGRGNEGAVSAPVQSFMLDAIASYYRRTPIMCRMHVRGAAGMANISIENQWRLDPCANAITIRGSLVRGPGGY